ncbi:MAG: GNAT family N-acetyltransferase [Acidobacteriota bacterium]
MDRRAVSPADHQACLDLAAARSPLFPPRLAAFLAHPADFYVLKHDSRLLACGGFSLSPNSPEAHLHWLLVSPSHERQGLGRYLTMFLLKQISSRGPISLVHASLPPPFETFLLKQGFHPHPGHLYTKRLTVCP